jgi:hypothetical protein
MYNIDGDSKRHNPEKIGIRLSAEKDPHVGRP